MKIMIIKNLLKDYDRLEKQNLLLYSHLSRNRLPGASQPYFFPIFVENVPPLQIQPY